MTLIWKFGFLFPTPNCLGLKVFVVNSHMYLLICEGIPYEETTPS
jgi:hypothetical protein